MEENINPSLETLNKDSFENWEQPASEETMIAASAEANLIDIDNTCEQGSQNLGKFANADKLLEAYNNLQAEFTKKSQKLSDLQKSNDDNLNKVAVPQLQESFEPSIFESESWTEKVASFVEQNKEAKSFSKEICEEILAHPEVYKGDNILEQAWANVAAKKYTSPQSLSQNDEFLNEYIFSQEHIKKKILNLYVNELKAEKAPKLISASSGSPSFSKSINAKTLEEAKAIVHNMFS